MANEESSSREIKVHETLLVKHREAYIRQRLILNARKQKNTLLCGAESWSMKAQDRKIIDCFE